MVETVPPLLKSLTISRSPSMCSPLNLPPAPVDTAPWKNQKPCCASPLLSKRSDPKNRTSHVAAPLLGHVALFASEYLAANPCTRLSLSGTDPSLYFQSAMCCGSFEPPPVKMVALVPSFTHDMAVAPF